MHKFISASLLAALVVAGVASAGTATATFPVSATVTTNCLVSTAGGGLAFGNYAPGGGALTGTTVITLKCTAGAVTVALNGGTTTGGTITQRLMASGTNTLQYNLYQQAAGTTLWGNGTTGSTEAATGAGVTTPVSLTVYGMLPDNATNQAAPAGSYTDLITVTATF